MFLSTLVRGSTGAGKLKCGQMSIKLPLKSSQIHQLESINLYLSANNINYVAPIPLGEEAPVQVVAYQPPPGYALVPLAEVSCSTINQDLFSLFPPKLENYTVNWK